MSAPVVLIGFMGSGKSSVARRLSRMLRLPTRDLDASVERGAGCTIAELFAREGEAAFRARETQALRAALRTSSILATGGGIVTRLENRDLLREAAQRGAHVVYLRAKPATLAARIRRQPGTRPLIDGGGAPLDREATQRRVEELLSQRAAFYEACATLVLDCDSGDTFAIASQIERRLRPPA